MSFSTIGMNLYPKISIIVHCFNREQCVGKTLDSIVSQEYPNLELIVIDDGSTDKSWEIIQSYKNKITQAERMEGKRPTPKEAINRGFALATGEVLGWLNAKNILLDKSLFTVAEIFSKHSSVSWITGLNAVIDDSYKVVRVAIGGRKTKYDFLAGKWNVIQQESTFWRKSLWDKADGTLDMDFEWSFDTALWCKFFKYAELYEIDTVLGAYKEVRGASQSGDSPDLHRRQNQIILDKFHKNASSSEKFFAFIYKSLRYAKPLLAVISHKNFEHFPLLNHFASNGILYNQDNGGKWQSYLIKRNPFRLFY